MKSKKLYIWAAMSNDESYYALSNDLFNSKEAAYNNMRDAVLRKMKWNTEFNEDFADSKEVDYSVTFSQDEIIHMSYSGTYVYRIVEVAFEIPEGRILL